MEIMKRALILILLLNSCSHRSAVRLVLQPRSTNNYPSYFASWLGFYKEEGLDVEISTVAGASKVLEAVVGGSADVGGGVYEQTLDMAEQGKSIVAFISLLKSPNFAIIGAKNVHNFADLRGKSVGVTSAGSPSQFYLNYFLKKEGVNPSEVGIASIGVNATAIAALEYHQVDAAVMFGTAVSEYLLRHPDAAVLADTRTPAGLQAAFHVDNYPASCLLADRKWLETNPDTAKRMARAVRKALTWLRTHSAEEVLAKVPDLGDREAELEAIRLAQPMYSEDGLIDKENAQVVASVRRSKVDVSGTFLNLN